MVEVRPVEIPAEARLEIDAPPVEDELEAAAAAYGARPLDRRARRDDRPTSGGDDDSTPAARQRIGSTS